MAAGLGFKTFATGDVLTAGDTNGYLMQGVWVFADAAARSAAVTSPQEGNISYLKDTNSTEYYSGSAWVAIGGGAAGGKLLQVVYATYSTATSVATTTFTDTGLSATITPTSATSKVLVLPNQQGLSASGGTTEVGCGLQLLRGASVIYTPDNVDRVGQQKIALSSASVYNMASMMSFSYLDSPATTSATTYKIQGRTKTTASGGQTIFQETAASSSMVLMEIGA